MEIESLISFLRFSNDFRKTERQIYAVDDERNENDVEHSFQLAIFAWYLIDTLKLKMDTGLVIKYSLVHDMDETFDGDKHIFDTVGRVDKEEKAKKARERIFTMFPDWTGYKDVSEKYQELEDEESRFVNALDKVLPVINIILDNGRSWKREVTTLKMLKENKRPKVNIHPVAEEIWNNLEKYMQDREMELFGKMS